MSVETPKVFDIRRCKLKIGNDTYGFGSSIAGHGDAIQGIADAGFGITPTAETTIITGLTGELGFNVDPRSGAEATVTLKSTSLSNKWLRELLKKQHDAMEGEGEGAGAFKPIQFVIEVDPEWVDAFGFAVKKIDYCVITKWPEFATDEKEAPDYEWGFVGYGYSESS